MSTPAIFAHVCQQKGWTLQNKCAELLLEGGKRHQMVYVEEFIHRGEAMMRVYSPVGPASALSETRMRSALSLNYQSPFGALAVRQDQLVLVDTFLLKDADFDEVSGSVEYLAETADRYEKTIFHTDIA